MNINKELLSRIAKNARLELTDSEKKEFENQLNDVLESFNKLDGLDTKNTEPSFHPIKINPTYREDSITKCLTQEEALLNTKHKKDGFFKGPKV